MLLAGALLASILASCGQAEPEASGYLLPWPGGSAYQVMQGPLVVDSLGICSSGCGSHRDQDGQHAWDFDLPEGTPVLAARAGTVGLVAGRPPGSDGRAASGPDTKIQSNQDAFRVREIADDLLDRFGQPSDEGREGENLVALSQLRILHQIDHFDRVPAVEMLLADLAQVREGED